MRRAGQFEEPFTALASRRYVSELDAVRASAVSIVIAHHYLEVDHWFRSKIELGWLGVHIFFVLSGFLISRILLAARAGLEHERGERSTGGLGGALRTFYVRRTLRIFPLYYATLAGLGVLALLGMYRMDTGVGANLFYVQNWVAMPERLGTLPYTGHLWTLAIEEQFYLVWPLVVLTVPPRRLGQVLWCMIAVGLASRVGFLLWQGRLAAMSATTSALDSFAVGGMLAWFATPWASGTAERNHRRLRVLGWSGFALLAAFVVVFRVLPASWSPAMTRERYELYFLLRDLPLAWAVALLIDALAAGRYPRSLRRLLHLRPVVWVGTVSYGLYVFHPFAPFLLRLVARRLGVDEEFPDLHGWALLLTVVGAGLSWRFFEGPVNGLKDRFAPPSSSGDPAAVQPSQRRTQPLSTVRSASS